ncbi:winged helix-turn-helix domain-containing protein [Neobacillus sp. PS2-9]|uniref:winged helix-turn-helix domain-containing protein n=1 Tax=Neobacillus sp. PS2-9 TaxID=3070676 RepID=UPI0027DEB252|nr:winged helix-turn-helix domain-containing protein [Neobacillus sp. PS2-9]WML59255.1 winged helix-turn-helix domain-containing protein [Neobacillus sp. PS2-9]
MKKIDDIEIAKMMLDVRKRSIIDIASKPVTVSQIAEELNEKQSRLYYHVKKLEEAGLLELVETRQQGNLIEKYYQRTKVAGERFELDEALLREHHDSVMEEIMKLLEPGLKLLQSELKQGKSDFDKQVNLMISLPTLTGREWETSHDRMMRSIREESEQQGSFEDYSLPKLSEEDRNKKSKYAYIMLSYRVEDAQ